MTSRTGAWSDLCHSPACFDLSLCSGHVFVDYSSIIFPTVSSDLLLSPSLRLGKLFSFNSQIVVLLRVLKSEGSQVFLGLDVFFPCKALLRLHFRFPSPSYIKHYHSPKNWEIVGIWIFTLSPPVDLQVVARPPSGSQSRYAGASCKETWVKTAATVLQVQCLFCLYFKCCHSMSSEIGLPVRDQTFQMSWF